MALFNWNLRLCIGWSSWLIKIPVISVFRIGFFLVLVIEPFDDTEFGLLCLVFSESHLTTSYC